MVQSATLEKEDRDKIVSDFRSEIHQYKHSHYYSIIDSNQCLLKYCDCMWLNIVIGARECVTVFSLLNYLMEGCSGL